MKLYKTASGPVVEADGRFYALPPVRWDELVNRDALRAVLADAVRHSGRVLDASAVQQRGVLPPVGSQEVWAAGVTYERSRDARQEESADADVYGRVYVTAGAGRNQVDAGGVRAETSISTGYADTADAVVRGSAKFHDTIETGDGDDVIRTGAGGSWIYSEGGDDEIRLGPGRDYVYEASGFTGDTHETVYGFADEDILFLYDIPRLPSVLDTDRNGRLDRRDGTVTVADGDMTLDLSPMMEGDDIKVTLVDRLAIDLDQLVKGCDC